MSKPVVSPDSINALLTIKVPALMHIIDVRKNPYIPEFTMVSFPPEFDRAREIIILLKKNLGCVVMRDLDQQYCRFHLF